MYFIVGILGAFSLYSYYDAVKKMTIQLLLDNIIDKNEKGSLIEDDSETRSEPQISIIKRTYQDNEFEVVPSGDSYELTEINHGEYSYLSSGKDAVYWPPKEKNNRQYLTIYRGDKNIENLFKRYAGPDKNFYDGNIYVKFILNNEQEVGERDKDITIMDNLGKFHTISPKEICYKFI